jgi:hypothetical protein
MSTLNLTNLFYSEKDIGATLKISKRQFIWEFDLNGSSQKIELLDSRLSRKKRLYKNGVNILDTTETGNFIHNFEIDGHACVIIQYGDKIELRIDNQSFTHLYNLQKNKELFAGEKGPTSNTYVAKPYNSYSSNEDKHTESAFYKVNKPEEENKPKLFNFEIKKNTGNKNSGGFNKFKFGGNKNQSNTSSNTNNNNNQVNSNNYNKNGNNGGNIDLLGFQDNQNTNQNNANNANNNNLLDFGVNNNNQNQSNNGNDIFNLMGNNTQNQNQQNNMNNNNQFNNIFLQVTDGTNQQPKFDQNKLGFLDFSNNNNNINNQNQQNSSQNNGQNKGTNADLFQF